MRSKRPQPDSLEWIDLKDLTSYAAVSDRTLREWIHRAENPLPASRVGSKILISRRKFDAWLEQQQVKPVETIDLQRIKKAVSGTCS
jgi:excisionase family DNA binding protein